MRVECSTLDDFLVNLGTLTNPASEVFGGAVYADVIRTPMGADANPVKFSVTFQVSAVIRLADGSEYLLAVGVKCGHDYEDASRDKSGSETSSKLKERLNEFCLGRNLTVRPGRVSE